MVNSGLDEVAGVELDHLGIAVRSIEEGLLTWRRLGYVETAAETVASEGVCVCFVEGPGVVELLADIGQGGPLSRFLASRGPGLHHLAYRVPDLAAAIGHLPWEFVGEIRSDAFGRPVVFAHPRSTGGVLVELVQGVRRDAPRST